MSQFLAIIDSLIAVASIQMHNCYIQNELSYCHAVCESHFICPFRVSWWELVIRLIEIQTILLNLADIGPNVCVACKLNPEST